MFTERDSHGIIFFQNSIYVCGGSSNDKILKKCEKYDLMTKRWIRIAEMNISGTGVSLSTFGNSYLYKFGGKIDSFTYSNSIEKYDVFNDEWTEIKYF